MITPQPADPKKSTFHRYIENRLARNKNFLMAICGPTGSGKTYSALRLGEIIDPRFNKERIVFSPLEFMRLLNNGNMPKGSVILFDEAGVTLNSRQWQSMANRLINAVLQTFRHKNYVVIFTSPHFAFVDSASRQLFHCYCETDGINKNTNEVRLKPFFIQVNQRDGKQYYKYLRVVKDGQAVPLHRIKVGLPSQALIDAYEEKKTAFTSKLNDGILRDLEAQENKGDKESNLTARQEEILADLKEGLSVAGIAKKYSVSVSNVYAIVQALKRKGHNIKTQKPTGGDMMAFDDSTAFHLKDRPPVLN